MKYSVAIRTLATSPETLRRELVALHNQTIPPEKIVIYIAHGYPKPDFRIGMEEYVEVKKGMLAQRALRYDEIESELLLLLDDDVEFSPDSAEILISELINNNADCIAVDSFRNHLMSPLSKFKALFGNWIFPRFDQKWAFKLHPWGGFSYINNPVRNVYISQSAAGPASLWKKSSFNRTHLEDELWIDSLGFPFGEDELLFYKLYSNGGKLMVSFDSGVNNLDGKSASSLFQQNLDKFRIRSKANLVRWYRMHYESKSNLFAKNFTAFLFALKSLNLTAIHLLISIARRKPQILRLYLNGIEEGIKFIKSDTYKNLPKFKSNNTPIPCP